MAPMKQPTREADKDRQFDSYSLTHGATRLHVTRRRLRQMLQQGELPFVQVRGQIRVPRWAIVLRKGNHESSGK